MLCAAHMARLGAAVDVFERHDPDDLSSVPPSVWVIALTVSAKCSIEAAGLSCDFGPQWSAVGMVTYAGDVAPIFRGDFAPQPFSSEHIAMATQRGIVAHLQAECERVYGDAVRVHYGMRVVGGAVCAGEVLLENAVGERVARTFDMIIGADGVESAVRKLMQEQDDTLKVAISKSALGVMCHLVHTPGHPATYATLPTPSGAPFHAVPEGFTGPLGGCVTSMVFPSRRAARDIDLCAIGIFHDGAEVSLAIAGDAAALARKRPEGELLAHLEATYPRLPVDWLRQAAAALQDQAVAENLRVRSPKFVTCSKLASGRALLLGDAAHAMSPNLGAGCNSALQDSEIFSRACIAAAGDVEAAARQYSATRQPNVQVLVRASELLDGFATARFHGNLLRAAAGLPYYMATARAYLPNAVPIPGFLKPGFALRPIFQQQEDWTGVPALVRGYTAKLAAIFAAAVVLVVVAAERGISLLST